MFPHHIFNPMTGMMNRGGAASVATYAEILRDTYGASEIWPLVNIASGTTITAFIDSARNGTLTGWDLQNAAGLVPGTLAPYSDAVNDYGDIDSVSHGSAFTPAECSILISGKASSWTDGATRVMLHLGADTSYYMRLEKHTTNNTMRFIRRASTTNFFDHTMSPSGLFQLMMTVSQAADQVKVFLNGSQVGSTMTGLGAWNVALRPLNFAWVGAQNGTPTSVWNGWLDYVAVKYGGIWTPTEAADIYAAAATAGAD